MLKSTRFDGAVKEHIFGLRSDNDELRTKADASQDDVSGLEGNVDALHEDKTTRGKTETSHKWKTTQ